MERMLRIQLRHHQPGRELAFVASGHANELGNPRACAAFSALTQNFVAAVGRTGLAGLPEKNGKESHSRGGRLERTWDLAGVTWPAMTANQDLVLMTLIKNLELGLEKLSATYPGEVKTEFVY